VSRDKSNYLTTKTPTQFREMMNIYQKLMVAVAASTMSFLVSEVASAQAALQINSQSVVVNSDSQEALFTLEFNEAPDFFSVDNVGRQADSFQYFIDADGRLPVFSGSPYFSQLETIIRGEEIHIAGDIRVRNVFGEGGLNSGGWGAIRGSVPFTLDGTVLKFSTPLSLLGDSDGQFSYRLEAYEFGASIRQFFEGISVIAPKVCN
jgi:hypothetical protein